MLQRSVGVQQASAHHTDVGLGEKADHDPKPVRLFHQGVVVEKHEHLAGRRSGTLVASCREVELAVAGDHGAVECSQLFEHLGGRVGVGHHDHVEIRVVGDLEQRANRTEHQRPIEAPHRLGRADGGNDHTHARQWIDSARRAEVAWRREMLDGGVDAEPFELVGHGPPPRIACVRLRLGIASSGARRDAPVVEHRRDVMHGPGPFGHPQDQVVILRSVVAGAKAADVGDDLASQHRQVRAVVLRTQPFRRPVGLEERVVDRSRQLRACLRRCRRSRWSRRRRAQPPPAPVHRVRVGRRGRAARRTRRWPSPTRRSTPRRCRRPPAARRAAAACRSATARATHRRTSGRFEPSSTRHSSQSPYVCCMTEERQAARRSSGGSCTGVQIENRGVPVTGA